MTICNPAPRTSLTTRTTCRICGCPHLAPVLSLGNHRIAGAWHFLNEFLEREHEFLGRGGRFIVPIPTVRIVPEA